MDRLTQQKQEEGNVKTAIGELGFLCGWVANHPQIAVQLALEARALAERYVASPTPDIFLRVPVPLALWNAFVEACGEERMCTEIATSLVLQGMQDYVDRHAR